MSVEVGRGVAPLERLCGAQQGRERAADPAALVPAAGTQCCAGFVAEDDGACGDVVAVLVWWEDGLTAGRLVFGGAATASTLDLFGARWAGAPVAGGLAEVATCERFGAGGGTGRER